MILEFIKAVALLLALSMMQGLVLRSCRDQPTLRNILSGMLFGGICVIGMMAPIEVSPGVIFDPRAVIVSMAGLFGGPVVGAIAAAIAGGYRAWLGGIGAPVGVAIIIACTALGVGYRLAHLKGWVKVDLLGLFVFGFVVQLVQVLLFLFLPDGIVQKVMNSVALPMIVIFTPATVLLGLLLKDVEQRLSTEAALLESEMRLSLHLENTPLAVISWDENFCCTQWNKSATQIFGYTAQEAIGRHWAEFMVPDDVRVRVEGVFESLMAKTGGTRSTNENRTKDGRTIICEWYNTPMVDNNGKVVGVASLGEDITSRKQSEELIWKQANYDPLTGLANRQMLYERLAQEIKQANRTQQSVALLFLDLDQFKEVNDTLGHDMGDVLLKEAAKRLSNDVREVDTVARLGGDEFTIIMGGLNDLGSVERVAADVLRTMERPFELGDETAYISTSIGITFYPQDADDADTMVKHADQAMYAAKSEGRNRFAYFTASMQSDSLARMATIRDLRLALPQQQLVLHYQPIIELKSGSIRKAEALVRWQHPTRGLVSPAEFIPVAEETRLINQIGDWTFREAARQVAQWRGAYHQNFQISVNTSPVQYLHEGFAISGWLEYLRELGLPGQAVAVEITEGLLMEAIGRVRDKLLTFRDAGIAVSLDDFGTGYSSLSYLKRFDIDYLKIDRAFVQNLKPESDDLALCEAIIVMAHKLGLEVIAEGIETREQCDLLLAAGCDFGQGFWFSKPVVAREFEEFLLEGKTAVSQTW